MIAAQPLSLILCKPLVGQDDNGSLFLTLRQRQNLPYHILWTTASSRLDHTCVLRLRQIQQGQHQPSPAVAQTATVIPGPMFGWNTVRPGHVSLKGEMR